MRTITRLALVMLTGGLLLAGCGPEDPATPTVPAPDSAIDAEPVLRELDLVRTLAAMPDGGVAKLSENHAAAIIQVPGGSVDALQAAITAAGPNGIVILKSGSHTESNSVVINQRVSLLGEPGATLTSDVDDYNAAGFVEPALHVRGASGVKIWGIDMRPADAIGGAAVLLENADHASISNNRMHDFSYGVMLDQSDQVAILGNEIVCSPAWQSGDIPESHGIVVINGERTRIAGNDVSQAIFGIWACHRRGWLVANNAHGNFIGIIFCKVPDGGFQLPSGPPVGAEFSATSWKATMNLATGNFDAGYLVIDGSNNNLLVANNAANNGTYDIDLAGDSFRFGFLTPTSFENRVIAAPFQNIRIKNCGNDNVVTGGMLEPNDAAHPCY